MGCIKSSSPLRIQNIEKVKRNEIEQNRIISTYVSSSQCGESEALSKISSSRSSNNSCSKSSSSSSSSSSNSNSNKESWNDKEED